MTFYLYSGAGNNFVVLDGREIISEMENAAKCDGECKCGCQDGEPPCKCGEHEHDCGCHGHEEKHHCCHGGGGGCCGGHGWEAYVQDMCDHFKTDGMMLLLPSERCDFEMAFFNPDGTGGMMCGNGGRCIVAFADYLGIKPSDGRIYHFEAGDGPHTGEILSVTPDQAVDGVVKTVRIRMTDVHVFCPVLDGWFVDTGTRHFVKFVPEVEGLNMDEEGKRYRWDPVFAPVGANANFVKSEPERLVVRTFEKGVEGETLACGTGITASAIASWLGSAGADGVPHAWHEENGRIVVPVRARQDDLQVEFKPVYAGETIVGFTDVYLTGPALLYGTE
ncbi:MAG: diaminopimelate epimerase [Bacteroidales bacterium]|nr:diaminopimelate epimerase [Bacteroidales bacterium]